MADDIVFKIRAEGTDKFVKDLKKAGVVVEDTGETVEKENKKMGGSFSKLGKTIGAAFTTAAIIQFTKVLAKAAVDIEATNAKTQIVFGESTRVIENFAKTSANAIGLTVNQYKRAAAAVGDLLVPIGFQRKEAAKLSNDLVKLSGALSAWTGGQFDATEVSQILTKALLGEREQLKQLGIQISEADVKQRLLEKGQKNLTGSSLAQAKATATLELITEKSKDAQTAFSDEVVTLAEAQAQLRANILQVRDSLAESLIPLFTKGTNVALKFAKALNRLTLGRALAGDFDLLVSKFQGFTDEQIETEKQLISTQRTLDKSQKELTQLTNELTALDEVQKANNLTLEEVEDRLSKIVVNSTEAEIEFAALAQRLRELKAAGEDFTGVESTTRTLDFLNKSLKDQIKILETTLDEDIFTATGKNIRALIKEINELKKKIKEAIVPLQDIVKIPIETVSRGDQVGIIEKVLFGEDGLDRTLAIPENFRQLTEDGLKESDRVRKKFRDEEAEEERIQAEIIRQIKLDKAAQGIEGISQLNTTLFDTLKGLQQAELQALQNKYDQGIISEKEFNEQRAEIQRKRAVADKTEAIFGITLNTARAIVAALTLPIGGRILAGIVAGIAAAQLAQVLAVPIPQFAEGTKGRKKAPRGWAWVGEEGPELMQMKGGEKIVTNQDSDELMRLLGGYGIPVQFNTLEKSLYKPMTKMEALVSNSSTPVDINPLIRSNDMNRFSLGKKLDRIHEAIVSTSTRKMTRA